MKLARKPVIVETGTIPRS